MSSNLTAAVNKIDEILEDSINVEGEVVHQLKTLPKGGIKGLMYYKSAIAQKNKIDLTVNISLELHSILSKLSEKEVKVLCHLIGIYFDNAIEAAKETRKKKVLIEISNDEHERELADLRQKYIMDQKAIEDRGIEIGIERGMEKGIEIGKEQGIQQAIEELAKKMLNENIEIEIIMKVTNLSKEEIVKLK